MFGQAACKIRPWLLCVWLIGSVQNMHTWSPARSKHVYWCSRRSVTTVDWLFRTISYQFSGALHHSCYRAARPEGRPFGNEVPHDHFPGNHAHRPAVTVALQERSGKPGSQWGTSPGACAGTFFWNSHAAGVEADGTRKPAISEQRKEKQILLDLLPVRERFDGPNVQRGKKETKNKPVLLLVNEMKRQALVIWESPVMPQNELGVVHFLVPVKGERQEETGGDGGDCLVIARGDDTRVNQSQPHPSVYSKAK